MPIGFYAVCSKCGRKSEWFEACCYGAETLVGKGWRGVRGMAYCPECSDGKGDRLFSVLSLTRNMSQNGGF